MTLSADFQRESQPPTCCPTSSLQSSDQVKLRLPLCFLTPSNSPVHAHPEAKVVLNNPSLLISITRDPPPLVQPIHDGHPCTFLQKVSGRAPSSTIQIRRKIKTPPGGCNQTGTNTTTECATYTQEQRLDVRHLCDSYGTTPPRSTKAPSMFPQCSLNFSRVSLACAGLCLLPGCCTPTSSKLSRERSLLYSTRLLVPAL